MKINSLDRVYGKNKTLVKEGFEYKIPNSSVVFKLRQFDSVENAELAKQAMSEDYKPFQKQLQNDTLPVERAYEINIKVWCKVALVGWAGLVDDDGAEIPYSPEKAVELMLQYEDLYKELSTQSRDSANFALTLGND